MSGTGRYDQYIPLFGRTNDNRVRLLLDELWDNANARRIAAGTPNFVTNYITINNIRPRLMNKNFITPDGGIADDAVHSEWKTFIQQLAGRLGGVSEATPLGSAQLAVIKSLAGNAQPGSIKEFMQVLVQALMANMVAGATDILRSPSQWGSVTGFTFQPRDEIINKLFTVAVANVPLGLQINGLLFSAKKTGANATYGVNAVVADKNNGGEYVAYVAGADTAREFNLNLNKYFIGLLLEEAAEAPVATAPASAFFDDITVGDDVGYFRKSDGLLYMRGKDGREVRVDAKSDVFKALTVENKCMSSGVPDSAIGNDIDPTTGAIRATTATCADYLRDCLSGKNIEKCRTYLTHSTFWNDAQAEVEAMLPAIAVNTLRAFEFEFENYFDERANRQLLRVKSVNQWLQSLNELFKAGRLRQEELDAITRNTKLIGYLSMIVEKTRKNPGILNKDYVSLTPVESTEHYLKSFEGTRLSRMGVRVNIPSDSSVSVSSIDRLGQAFKDQNARVAVTIGYPQLHGYSQTLVLRGGATDPIEQTEEYLVNEHKQTWSVIQRHYLLLKQKLGSHNKSLSPADEAKINQLILNLRESEVKLTKTILYAEKYARLIEVHGQRDNTSVLSLDHLKQFVDARNKYFTRVAKKQNDLISVIRAIAEAVGKESTQSVDEKTNDVNRANLNFSDLL